MFGREELESLDSNIFYVGEDLYLVADKVYEVMDKMEAKIKELESQLPKWISIKDRLPTEEEQSKLLWVAYVRMDNTIKYMYEALFDYKTKQFYTENDWGDKTFIEPSIWMVVPQPSTTVEK